MRYVGVDMHKKMCQAVIVDESGEVLDEFRFKNNREGIEGFALKLKGFRDGVRVAVAHEMLRIVWFMLKRNEPYRGERSDLSRRKLKRLERCALVGLQV